MTAAGWLPDPYGRYEFRYWDGQRWTDQVMTRGRPGTDASADQAAPAAVPFSPPPPPPLTIQPGITPPPPPIQPGFSSTQTAQYLPTAPAPTRTPPAQRKKRWIIGAVVVAFLGIGTIASIAEKNKKDKEVAATSDRPEVPATQEASAVTTAESHESSGSTTAADALAAYVLASGAYETEEGIVDLSDCPLGGLAHFATALSPAMLQDSPDMTLQPRVEAFDRYQGVMCKLHETAIGTVELLVALPGPSLLSGLQSMNPSVSSFAGGDLNYYCNNEDCGAAWVGQGLVVDLEYAAGKPREDAAAPPDEWLKTYLQDLLDEAAALYWVG